MGEKQALVPSLRFPEFRNEGEWEESLIDDICYMQSGKFIAAAEISSDFEDGMFPCFGGNGLRGYTKTYNQSGRYSLIGRQGALCGNVNLVEGDFYATEHAVVTTPKLGISTNWLFYNLTLLNLNRFATGQAQPGLSVEVLDKVPCAVPINEKEQQKIADCLSSLDELIAAQAEKINALKTHKKGLMQQLFPREGETLPRLRFPEFRGAEEWVEKPLSVLVKSLDAGVSVNSGDRPAKENESGILKTSAVTAGVFEPKENKVVTDELEQSRLKEPVLKNTIIISRMNTPALVGANAYVTESYENLYLPDRLWAAKPTSEGDIRFTAYILGSSQGRSSLSELATGTSGSMKNISKSAVLDLKVLVPSTEEQQKIAECLSSIDTLIAAHAEKLGTFKVHKKGLMQQLFPAIDRGGL